MRLAWLLVPVAALVLGGPVQASHASTHGSGHSHSTKSKPKSGSRSKGSKCSTCARNSHGRIARSPKAKADFMRQTGYPHGRPGYVVDHLRALECGGSDAPSNMQWQTIAAAKAKDKTERHCR